MSLNVDDFNSKVRLFLAEVVTHPVMIFTAVFVLFLTGLSFADVYVGEALEYDKNKIQAGEWWRLLTGNFVHFGLYHTVMNSVSICLISFVLFWFFPLWVWITLIFVLALADGFGLFLFSPDIDVYRGYSGAVYGLAIIGLVLNWSVNPWINSAVILALLGKMSYEHLPGFDVNHMIDEIGVPVAVDAHLWGGLTGIALSVPFWFLLKGYRELMCTAVKPKP